MNLSGFVLDSNGNPLPGASVLLTTKVGLQYLPTGIGTTTNAQGYYSISSALATAEKWVTISYVGFVTANVPVDYIIRQNTAGEDVATFLTQADPTSLENVTVTTTAKKDFNWLWWVAGGLLAYKILKGR